jgi:hypothetical protein
MPHRYDYNPSAAQSYKDFGTRGKIIFWLIMIFLVIPFCGFFTGGAASSYFPSSAYLTSPAVCSNGTLVIHQVDSPSKTWGTSWTIYDYCVDSHTGTTSDITQSVSLVGGLIVPVVGSTGLALILILVGIIRLLTGRSFV